MSQDSSIVRLNKGNIWIYEIIENDYVRKPIRSIVLSKIVSDTVIRNTNLKYIKNLNYNLDSIYTDYSYLFADSITFGEYIVYSSGSSYFKTLFDANRNNDTSWSHESMGGSISGGAIYIDSKEILNDSCKTNFILNYGGYYYFYDTYKTVTAEKYGVLEYIFESNDRSLGTSTLLKKELVAVMFEEKISFLREFSPPISKFNLLFPTDKQIIKKKYVDFTWGNANKTHIEFPEKIKYSIFMDKDSIFTDPIIIADLTDTVFVTDSLLNGQKYFWKILASNSYGDSLWSSNVNVFFTNVEMDEETIPLAFVLEQNYPNPFNPATTIKYKIPVATLSEVEVRNVNLEIFNTLGQKIKTLVNKPQKAGTYEVEFHASNLPSGVFYYRLQYGKYSETKKMLLIR